MKKILYILSSAILLMACSDDLELTSPSTLTFQGFWDTEDGARAAHAGLYSNFRSENFDFWALGELRSDIWGGATFESPFNTNIIESNISTSSVPFGSWAGFYTRIHRLNDFITNVPGITFKNEEEKAHMLGQAYGMRAYFYYTLLRTWGAVPITSEPQVSIDPSQLSKERSSAAEVMTFVKADIEKSLEAFGTDGSFWNGKRIYWSKAATLALKGDVFLWSGNLMGGGNTDFTTAKNTLQQIAALGVELQPTFEGAFAEENSELIFAFDYEEDQATNFYNSMTGRGTEIHPRFDQNGNSMGTFVTNGSNRYGPSEKTLLTLDDSDDSRGNATFIKLYTDDNGGAGYTTYTADKYFGAVINKFIGSVTAGGSRIATNDVPLYRYADVILMIAEAKNHLGEDPSGEINQIRQRAYGDNYVAATHEYTNSTKEANTRTILDERYKEFVAEGKRWWDLRRAGDAYVYENVSYISSADSHLLLLPITLDMIGRNPLLVQTTGYTN